MKTKLRAFLLVAALFLGLPLASSSAFVAVSVGIAPPPIPVYEQPPCPVDGYIWTPGYWNYTGGGYYWVPGVWVAPPQVGFLWTPGYWGYRGGRYLFTDGYWGPTVGYYGGINYGFGYGGFGYVGGEWAGGVFRYNTAVTRVNTTVIHNTYVNNEVVNNNNGSRASFNGAGGSTAKPTPQQLAAAKAPHVPATAAQKSVAQAARSNPALQAKNNHGKPSSAALASFNKTHAPAAAPKTAAVGAANKTSAPKTAPDQGTKARTTGRTATQPKRTVHQATAERTVAARTAKPVEHTPKVVSRPRTPVAHAEMNRQPHRAVAPRGGRAQNGKKKPERPEGQ